MKRLDMNLCIGGPLDRGHVVGVSIPESYTRRDLSTENVVFGVWVWDRMSPDEAMQALLDAYVDRSALRSELSGRYAHSLKRLDDTPPTYHVHWVNRQHNTAVEEFPSEREARAFIRRERVNVEALYRVEQMPVDEVV